MNGPDCHTHTHDVPRKSAPELMFAMAGMSHEHHHRRQIRFRSGEDFWTRKKYSCTLRVVNLFQLTRESLSINIHTGWTGDRTRHDDILIKSSAVFGFPVFCTATTSTRTVLARSERIDRIKLVDRVWDRSRGTCGWPGKVISIPSG